MPDPQIITETFAIWSLFILVCEDNIYNLLVERNYFQKHSPIAFPQKCFLKTCSKFTGDPYGNVTLKKVA